MNPKPYLLPILPTRVRRNYRGGMELDRLAGAAHPQDGDRPESWIASTLTATNPDLPPEPGEGLTRVLYHQQETTLKALLDEAPDFYLGQAHHQQLGSELGFLAKFLDSSMRLHVQVHPTSTFARERMNAPYGKLEVYYVLGVRDGSEGYLRMGFQHSPGRERWREIVAQQDIPAMDACFEKIPVTKGDVWIVPGGLPHAIGEGVLMIEIMEPSDLVVRCEFERDGVLLPPNSRYMGRDLDFCLDVFDYRSYSQSEVKKTSLLEPVVIIDEPGWQYTRLVGAQQTSRFEVFRLRAQRPGLMAAEPRCGLVIQVEGEGELVAGNQTLKLRPGDACFLAASTPDLHYSPTTADSEVICCRPLINRASYEHQ